MTTIDFNDNHWPILDGWNDKRGIARYRLGCRGLMVVEDGKEIACGFLIQTDAGFAMVEQVTTNPDAPARQRKKGLERLIGDLGEMAVGLGFEIVLGVTSIPSIKKLCANLGWKHVQDASIFVR